MVNIRHLWPRKRLSTTSCEMRLRRLETKRHVQMDLMWSLTALDIRVERDRRRLRV